MEQNELDYLTSLEQQNIENRNRANQLMQAQQTSFQSQENENLIQWQLELDNILERIEHLLKGDELKFDERGNLIWKETKDENKRTFNDYGVQCIMRTLSMYINRDTILSNYDEETINNKVYDLGIELSDLIYMKYELMGLDTNEKIKDYMMIVREIVDIVHSTYLRALNGGERDSLRTARSVNQSQPLGSIGIPSLSQSGSKNQSWNWIRPSTWFSKN